MPSPASNGPGRNTSRFPVTRCCRSVWMPEMWNKRNIIAERVLGLPSIDRTGEGIDDLDAVVDGAVGQILGQESFAPG